MNDNLKFYIPAEIEKATNSSGQEVMKFKGIASTDGEDSQKEFLDPAGFDLSEFKFVNWNHLGGKDSATIIGEPTKAVINEKNQFYVEGILFPEVTMAKSTWNLMKALQNSKSGNKLGISVEGKCIERGCGPEFLDKEKTVRNPGYSLTAWNKITKAKITSIALCPVPVNGGTWADIMKGEMKNDLTDEEEYDEETKKAMTAEAGEGVTSKESVETTGDKKPLPSLEGGQEINPNKLKKSEIFERIFEKFPGIELEKAKSVYNLIEKTKITMSKQGANTGDISNETIEKAFELLNLVAKPADDINKSENNTSGANSGGGVEDEDQKEMVAKASKIVKSMSAENKDAELIKSTLIEKGFGEKVIAKAMEVPTEGSSLSKSDIGDLFKSHVATITENFDKKFLAVGQILKKSQDDVAALSSVNDEIKKSLDETLSKNAELNTKLENVLKTPNNSKSMISKSYQERFGDEKAEGAEKSKKYNINNDKDRKALLDNINEKSGIMKGVVTDQRLVDAAKELEITKNLSMESVNILKAMDIEVLTS